MSTFKETTLVAELCKEDGVCVRERERQSERNQFTTLPGERLDLRQVDVSVVQQLKQRRRTRSLSLVAASSV